MIGDSNPNKDMGPENGQKDPDDLLRGLSSDSCQSHEEGNDSIQEESESSGNKETEIRLAKPNSDEQLANEKLTTEDIALVISTMKKEAEYDEVSIKQLFYGYCSAFTKCPIPHAINSRDSGAGKTYLLVTVAGYFPSKYIIELAGMSDKALVHRPGTLVTSEYNEETDEEETRAIAPLISELELQIEEIQEKDKLSRQDRKEIKVIEARIKDVKNNAEKLIELDNQIILCLDTPQDSLLSVLMSLISQDTPRDQKYTFAEKSVSGQLRTRVNRLRGMPVLFTTRVIDDTRGLRFDEKNRRFINITPDTSKEKIKAANKLIGYKYGCLPEEYDALVVGREDKEKCRHIIKVIIAKLRQHSVNLKPKDSGIMIPIPITEAISESIPVSENQVWSMTVQGRLMKYLAIITKIHMDCRPKILDKETCQSYPIMILDDLKETLELMERAASSLRPYIAKWYSEVFLPTFKDQDGKPNELRDDEGIIIVKRQRVKVCEIDGCVKTPPTPKRGKAPRNRQISWKGIRCRFPINRNVKVDDFWKLVFATTPDCLSLLQQIIDSKEVSKFIYIKDPSVEKSLIPIFFPRIS